MKMYVADIREADRRLEAAAGPGGLLSSSPERGEGPAAFYRILVLKVEDGGVFGPAVFVFSVFDPKGNNWVLRKK